MAESFDERVREEIYFFSCVDGDVDSCRLGGRWLGLNIRGRWRFCVRVEA